MNIDIRNISKSFGQLRVFRDVNFLISSGSVCALLGKNGAGKSTLIHILISLLLPDDGEIYFDGKSYPDLPTGLKKRIGVLTEDNPLIEELTIQQYLKLSGKIYGLDSTAIESRSADLIDWFFTEPEKLKQKRISNFSTGMKKKAGLIAAVLHTPDFLILDEPFSGLDPIAAQECVDFIKMYSNSKRTILLSTHNLNYVEESADQIVVLENQSVQFDGNTNDFTKNGSARISSVLMGLLQRQKKTQTKPDWI